jgi:hypothetical protein
MIFFSDWESALLAHEVMGFDLFFPRKGIFSMEEQKDVILFEDGEWKTMPFDEIDNMKCTCGCNVQK